MKEKTVNELPGTPSLYKEVLRSDWDKAQATIEQQAQYIEQQDDAYALLSLDAGRKIDELEQGLAALRAQQPGVVDAQRLLDWNRAQPEPRPIVVGREYQVAEVCARLDSSLVSSENPCECGGSPHTAQCRYEHFLAYSALSDQPLLRYTYFHGADAECEKPAFAVGVDERLREILTTIREGYEESMRACIEDDNECMADQWREKRDEIDAALTASAQSVPDRSEQVRVILPPSPYMPDGDPDQMTDYERGEAQGRCDMWAEVKRLNSSPVSAGNVPARPTGLSQGWNLVRQCDGFVIGHSAEEPKDHYKAKALADGRVYVPFLVPVSAGGVDEWAAFEAIDWLDDFVARCNGDDRGACESVNIVRTALQARAALTASATTAVDVEWSMHMFYDRWPNTHEQVDVALFAEWLRELLASIPTASAQSVPDGFRVMKPTSAVVFEGDRWEIYAPCGSGGIVSEHDVKDWVVRKLLDAIAAAPAPGKGGAE